MLTIAKNNFEFGKNKQKQKFQTLLKKLDNKHAF